MARLVRRLAYAKEDGGREGEEKKKEKRRK